MDFVDRQEDLLLLETVYHKAGFQFVPVYGRRRLGKTRLIEEFIRNKAAIYFLADTVSEMEQLKGLGRLLGEFFNDSILVHNGFRDWYQLFSYLKEKVQKRLILIVDEFPYLVRSTPAISSIFQKGIDQSLKDTNLMLILMGSHVGMMEEEVLFYKAPLYGRRTASLEVREMDFVVLPFFFPGLEFRSYLGIYSVVGTVPAYLEHWDPSRSILQNIRESILSKGTFLYNEVEYILREELREPRNYFVILKAIASGKRKLSEIINETGFEKSLVSRYIDILTGLGFVQKLIPVTEKSPEKSKKGIYFLHDPFFTFWFKYVFPNRSSLEIGNVEFVLKKIQATMEQHLSINFEKTCMNQFKNLLKGGRVRYTTLGRWWSAEGKIDVVALDEETDTAYFGECKWRDKLTGTNVYEDLVKKSRLVDWRTEKRKNRYVLFSKRGFTKAMTELARKENVLLIHQNVIV